MARDLREVVIKVLDTNDQLRGTGFVVEPAGTVLTCHHVIDGLSDVRLVGPTGERCDVSLDDAVLMPARDLALLPAKRGIAPELAISPVGPAVGDVFRSAGFHRLGDQIGDSFPVTGTITGTTHVRYCTAAYRYDLTDVLVLADDHFAEGLSGAPVTDADGAVVVGVISTRLDGDGGAAGFGVPLPTNAPAELSPVLACNDRLVPALGTHLNTAGLHELCSTQVAGAVRALSETRGVDLDRRVDRTGIVASLGAETSAGVRGLVGPSGIGKSTELAHASSRADLALLVMGSTIPVDSRGIEDVIAETLGTAGHGVTTELIASRAKGRLRIFVDGLNESALPPRALRDWLISTDSWCRKAGVSVVVSCRPESWRFTASRFEAITLAEFTHSEAVEAAAAYGLLLSSTVPILRLPLAVRLAAELPTAGRRRQSSVNALIAEYVLRAAENVAGEIGGAASGDTVLRWLIMAATTMLTEDIRELTPGAAARIFPEALLAADHVVRENLMSRTTGGLRFVYDDVADWLASRQIDVTGLLALAQAPTGATGYFSYRYIGPLGYALRDILDGQEVSAFHAELTKIIEPRSDFGMTAILLLQETIGKCEPLTDHLEFLTTFARAFAGSAAAGFFTTEFWAGLPLPTEGHLAVLRELVRADDDWGWRPGDWASRPLRNARSSYGTVASRIVERDVERGFQLLRPWFDDRRRLDGGEATVSDVAAGIAFRLRRQAPHALWRLIAWLDQRATRLVRELCAADPDLVADLVAAVPADERDSHPLLTAVHALPLTRLDAGRRAAMIEVVSAMADDERRGPEERAALSGILADNTDDPAPVDFLYAEFAAGRLPARAISDHLLDDPDRAIEAVRGALYASAERRNDALVAFRHLSDERLQRAIDTMLLEMLDTGLISLTVPICDYVGGRLYVVDALDSATEPALTAMLTRVIEASPGRGRLGLARVLSSPDALRGDQPMRRRLALELLEAAPDRWAVAAILNGSAGQITATEFQEELVVAAARRLDAVDADRALTGAAYAHDDFAQVLARLLDAGELAPMGPRVTRFAELLGSGRTALDAIHIVIVENPT